MIQDLCDVCKDVVEKEDLKCRMRAENRWLMQLVDDYKMGINFMGPDGPHGDVALCPKCIIDMLRKRFPRSWKIVVDNS